MRSGLSSSVDKAFHRNKLQEFQFIIDKGIPSKQGEVCHGTGRFFASLERVSREDWGRLLPCHFQKGIRRKGERGKY